MDQDLSHWVRSFSGRRVLLIGDLILDRYLYGDAERISPEAPVPVLRAVERHESVGGSANVAACLRALGCSVVCCGVVGDDPFGRLLKQELESIGVDTGGILIVPDRPTTTKTRMVGLAQHRHRQQLLRVDEEETGPLSEASTASLIKITGELAAQADVVCLEDYDKGVVGEHLAQAVIGEAGRKGCRVLVDPARLSDYRRYQGADVLTPNREELSLVAGRRFASLEELAAAGQALLVEREIKALVVTVDREGAVLVEQGKEWRHLPTVPRSVYDNTGAGDAVLASATRLANVAGGLEVEKFGCVPITADEVLAELRMEGRLGGGKLRSADELVAELQLHRDRGETVAFTNGCFDILHAGHVDLLQRCRKEASLLVIGLNSDSSVRTLEKGTDRPINKFEHRAAVLGALECVDYVVGFEEPDPEALIRKIRPDVLIKGGDWARKGVVGQSFVESAGGRVVLLPLVEGVSTTELVSRIRRGGS